MLNKINIVLNSIDESSKRGVLSLNTGDGDGKLRLYGFDEEPRGILSLGMTSSSGVIKAGLTKKANMLYTFSADMQDVQENFSCAVVNFVGGEPTPILFGASNGGTIESQLENVLGALKSSQNIQEVEDTLDQFGLDYDEELKDSIEKQIDEQMEEFHNSEMKQDDSQIESCSSDCKNCVYKKSFYQENVQNMTKNDEKQQKNDENDEILPNIDENIEQAQPEFYGKIKDQIDILFSQNGEEEFLQSAIPQSKWVKVELDGGGDYYVFGLIYDEDELKFVCYGVPGLYTPLPPKQLSGYPVWFPVDKDKKEGFGYWLTYQDASTGESVKAIIE